MYRGIHTHTHLYRHTCTHIHTHTYSHLYRHTCTYTHTHTPVKSRHSDGPRSSCSRWLCCDGWTDSHFYSAAGRSPVGRRVWQHAVSVVLTPLQTLQKTGTGSQSPFSWCGAPEKKKSKMVWLICDFFLTPHQIPCVYGGQMNILDTWQKTINLFSLLASKNARNVFWCGFIHPWSLWLQWLIYMCLISWGREFQAGRAAIQKWAVSKFLALACRSLNSYCVRGGVKDQINT